MQALANGLFLEFDTFGSPTAEPLLLISGLNTPMTRWTPDFCERLAKRGFYVIRFDNRDCGLSTHFDGIGSVSSLNLLLSRIFNWPVRSTYTLADMVDDAIGLLDALEIKAAHIVGRSMGGLIAQALACEYPARVLSLTAIMSSTGNRQLPLPSFKVLQHLLIKKPSPKKNLEAYLKRRVAYTQAIGSPRFPLSDSYIRARVLDDIKRSGFHAGAAKRQLAALLSTGDIRPMIRKINIPTLVIHGDSDALVPLKCGMDVHRNIPGARLKIVKDMGHSLQPEFYEELIEVIGEFRSQEGH
jgi:proline iminopeptidase